MTIHIPASGPMPNLLDIDVTSILAKAAETFKAEAARLVDSGHSPSGEAIPQRDPDTVARRLRAGSATPGHRTGLTKLRWRTRVVTRGKHAGSIRVELAPIGKYRNQLSCILGATDHKPSTALMDVVNKALEPELAKAVLFRRPDGSMGPVR